MFAAIMFHNHSTTRWKEVKIDFVSVCTSDFSKAPAKLYLLKKNLGNSRGNLWQSVSLQSSTTGQDKLTLKYIQDRLPKLITPITKQCLRIFSKELRSTFTKAPVFSRPDFGIWGGQKEVICNMTLYEFFNPCMDIAMSINIYAKFPLSVSIWAPNDTNSDYGVGSTLKTLNHQFSRPHHNIIHKIHFVSMNMMIKIKTVDLRLVLFEDFISQFEAKLPHFFKWRRM